MQEFIFETPFGFDLEEDGSFFQEVLRRSGACPVTPGTWLQGVITPCMHANRCTAGTHSRQSAS